MKRIEFDKPTLAVGRNGIIKQKGVQIINTGGYLEIKPLTSKGVPGNCKIQIPPEYWLDFLAAVRVTRHHQDY